MGIGASIAGAMEETQRKLMAEQMEKQWKMQKKAQERMRRQMIAFNMAAARERCYWLGTSWTFMTLGLASALVRKTDINKLVFAPYGAFSMFFAYNLDFAFGNKANRINEFSKEILNDESYWFIPLEVEIDEKKSNNNK